MQIEALNPPTLAKPTTPYSHAVLARVSESLFISGMTADDAGEKVNPEDFEGQCEQVYRAIGLALAAANMSFSNVVRFTTYLTSARDVPRFKEYRQRAFPRLFPNGTYPANTLLIVQELFDPSMRIEVQTTAVR